jgi:hypothetical protein
METDAGELPKPGPFRPLTPEAGWSILGRTICRIGRERGDYSKRLAKGHSSSGGIEPGQRTFTPFSRRLEWPEKSRYLSPAVASACFLR